MLRQLTTTLSTRLAVFTAVVKHCIVACAKSWQMMKLTVKHTEGSANGVIIGVGI